MSGAMAIRTVIVLTVGLLALPISAHAVDGAQLFDTRCRLCHQDEGELKNKSSTKIKNVLQSDKVAEHRFALSKREIDSLVRYLEQQGQRN